MKGGKNAIIELNVAPIEPKDAPINPRNAAHIDAKQNYLKKIQRIFLQK